jgi:acyl-CoA thioester hydrolase
MRHLTELRVRFGDTDMLGHVNNASYFTYMEEARCDFVQAIGMKEVPLILASAKVDFRAQSYFGDTLEIETWVTRIGNSSFDVANVMRNAETGTVVFEGVAVIVYFDYAEQKPKRIPDDLRKLLEQYLEPASASE